MTNTKTIVHNADIIANHERALKWLEEHGVNLTGNRDDVQAFVTIETLFAGSCDGAKEARQVMEAIALLGLPEIVNKAIAFSEKEIATARNAIREELER